MDPRICPLTEIGKLKAADGPAPFGCGECGLSKRGRHPHAASGLARNFGEVVAPGLIEVSAWAIVGYGARPVA